MKKILSFLTIFILGISVKTGVYAVSREEMVGGARLNSNLTNTYNVTSVVINSGGTQIGSTLSPSLLAKIQKAINEIEKMKMRLRK